LPRQHIGTRIQLYKRDLTGLVTQNLVKCGVYEIKLRSIQPKRDGKFQALRGARSDEHFVQLSVAGEVGGVAIN
jgi:hypothetical protein